MCVKVFCKLSDCIQNLELLLFIYFVFSLFGAGDGTQGFTHARQVLYP
jgi:hypothetical protein